MVTTPAEPTDSPEQPERVGVPPEVIMTTFERMYPREFAHVMTAVEADYWRNRAMAAEKPKAAKRAVKKTSRTGGKGRSR